MHALQERDSSERESQEVERLAREANIAKSFVALPLAVGVDGPSKPSAGTGSVQAERDPATSNTTLAGPSNPASSRAGISATGDVGADTSPSPSLAVSRKESRHISEVLVRQLAVVGDDACQVEPADGNVKDKIITMSEGVPLPVVAPDSIRDGDKETITAVK